MVEGSKAVMQPAPLPEQCHRPTGQMGFRWDSVAICSSLPLMLWLRGSRSSLVILRSRPDWATGNLVSKTKRNTATLWLSHHPYHPLVISLYLSILVQASGNKGVRQKPAKVCVLTIVTVTRTGGSVPFALPFEGGWPKKRKQVLPCPWSPWARGITLGVPVFNLGEKSRWTCLITCRMRLPSWEMSAFLWA